MWLWLLGVAICVLIWGTLWKRNIIMASGILVGFLLAWLLSYLIKPYVTGMETIPVWLPPISLATVAIVLFVYGALVWIRGNDALPKKKPDSSHDKH